MTTKSNPPKDLNETAFSIMPQATGEVAQAVPNKEQEDAESGLAGGKACAAKHMPAQRTEITKKAARKRWSHFDQ